MIELDSLIESTPGVAGGRPCLAGTGMPVVQIAVHYRAGETPKRILHRYPHLDLQRIHAAIAFYLANRGSMDDEIAAEAADYAIEKQAARSLARHG